VNALKRAGVRVDLIAESATTEGIVRTLSREDLKGKTVLVQLYGKENPDILAALQKRGATVIGVSIYSYTQASDTAALEDLVKKILDKRIDAITFTSATQVPFLFRTADALASPAVFRQRLKKDVVVASVGEVTSRALRDAGVEPHVQPAEPKMGPMVKALGEFFEKRRR
jgi:uroporphyrinogen-III synthase